MFGKIVGEISGPKGKNTEIPYFDQLCKVRILAHS